LNQMGGGHDVPWGTGKGDVKGMLAELKRQNLKAVFSIEYEFGDQGKPEMMENLAKCAAFFEQTAAELQK
jgi:L-ribulose-5-phosphate 3-epimerase UlaE